MEQLSHSPAISSRSQLAAFCFSKRTCVLINNMPEAPKEQPKRPECF